MAPRTRPVLAIATAALLAAACGSTTPSPSAAPPASAPSSSAATSADPSAAPRVATSAGPIGSTGSIAVLADDGSISVIGADGTSTLLDDTSDGMYGFPTWSPDGSRIAAVRSDGTNTSVVVFDAPAGGSTSAPKVIFAKPSAAPFYLYWTPDGEDVSFLVTEADVLNLRLAPADGSAPLDGSGAGSLIRSGNPFYYDWLSGDRLLAHIGSGSDAFLGELGVDGVSGTALEEPGDFRSAVVSPDHASIAFVRGATGGPGEVVVSGRDGSNEHSMTVYGQTALMFDPSGTRVASIGASRPDETAGFPLGPLKVIDGPSGEVRTLVDGAVASFWWSPDGKTIAALRVQPTIGSATPSGEPAQDATNEVRLIFVDVASGATLSQPVIRPTERFVTALIAYFDQYALSHQLWAPDGSALLMPEIGDDGVSHVAVRHPDGSEPITLDGEIAFWSP
ncbi:MAG TPA: hypothetical protein VK867_09035 [Candidatus Limnocylindrales bacterium]|nr:hypothetical protein [Candidatus Limnocylindrales bacterium]